MRSIGMRYESWSTSEPRGSPTRESEVDASETAAYMKDHYLRPKCLLPWAKETSKTEGQFVHHLIADVERSAIWARTPANVRCRKTQGNLVIAPHFSDLAPQCAANAIRKLAPQEESVTRSSRTNCATN